MQTFLPLPDFIDSLRTLDYKRLGKQRVETWQLLQALQGQTKGWVNHPAARMWRGAESALCDYGIVSCALWIGQGYRDTMLDRFVALRPLLGPYKAPLWLGDNAFHASHRSNLLRKDPVWYGKFGWSEPDDLPYVWPEEA